MENITKKPALCLDFDGVLHSYKSGWHGANQVLDPPVEGAIAFLREAVQHFEVSVYSARSHQLGGIPAMQRWLEYWIVQHRATDDEDTSWMHMIQWPTYKPSAFVSLDDRTITFTGVFPPIAELKRFKAWNKV